MNIPEVGKPNTNPPPGNIIWEHPRVEAANNELVSAASHYSEVFKKNPQETSFVEFSDACNRLHWAAIAYANTIKEYTI